MWVMILIGIVALVYLANMTGLYQFGGAKTALAVTGGDTTVVTSQGGCPTTGLTQINSEVKYLDATTGIDTTAATNVYLYKAGTTNAFNSGTSLTNGYFGGANTSVDCGSEVRLIAGDAGTTYYYVQEDRKLTPSATSTFSFKVKKQSALTMTATNTTAQGQNAVSIVVGSGAVNSDVTIRLKASANHFGNNGIELCALYLQSNISKIAFGADWVLINNDPAMSVTTGQVMSCYQKNTDISNYGYIDVPVVITSVSGVTPVSNITIKVNDLSAYLKNGALISGYVNTDTNADIGATIVTSTDIIHVNN